MTAPTTIDADLAEAVCTIVAACRTDPTSVLRAAAWLAGMALVGRSEADRAEMRADLEDMISTAMRSLEDRRAARDRSGGLH